MPRLARIWVKRFGFRAKKKKRGGFGAMHSASNRITRYCVKQCGVFWVNHDAALHSLVACWVCSLCVTACRWLCNPAASVGRTCIHAHCAQWPLCRALCECSRRGARSLRSFQLAYKQSAREPASVQSFRTNTCAHSIRAVQRIAQSAWACAANRATYGGLDAKRARLRVANQRTASLDTCDGRARSARADPERPKWRACAAHPTGRLDGLLYRCGTRRAGATDSLDACEAAD